MRPESSCSRLSNLEAKPLNSKQLAFLTAPPSALTPEAQVNGSRLHGHAPPRHVIEAELPWHRIAAYMFGVCGMVTIKDVAEACDVDPATVSNLLRQPWFQERVTELQGRSGQDIMQLFRAEQFNSLVTLIEIRDDGSASKRDRLTSAMNILDRALGKPTQRIEQSSVPSSVDPVAEVEQLEKALGTERSSYHPGEIPEDNPQT